MNDSLFFGYSRESYLTLMQLADLRAEGAAFR